MVFDLPFRHVKQLGTIFNLLDTNKNLGHKSEITELKALVSDVGVSQTTLEEVFMAVTSNE